MHRTYPVTGESNAQIYDTEHHILMDNLRKARWSVVQSRKQLTNLPHFAFLLEMATR